MRDLGIDFISVFGLPPVEFVHLAADLGCPTISTALEPPGPSVEGHAPWSLRDDEALRRAMREAMAERGVSIALGEGLVVFPDRDVRDLAPDVDVMAELGVTRLGTLSFDPDMARSVDQFGVLADMAAAAGMELVLEFTPSKKIATLEIALDVVGQIARPNVKVLVDTMHFARGGSKLETLKAVDPDRIGYVQLCDAPRGNRFDTYVEEAFYDRMIPGAGELPLQEILAALPRGKVVSLEVPLRAQAQAGVGPRERLGAAVEAGRKLLAQVG
jgi:sugar phosphate isomerase/epimerase